MIDIEHEDQLIAYLRDSGRIDADEAISVTPISGGVSSRTMAVRRQNGECWVMKQALAKLRVETDWFSDVERVHREAVAMRWIGRLVPGATTEFLFEDHAEHLLAMECVPEPHVVWKDVLLRGDIEMSSAVQFGDILGSIHASAPDHAAELEPLLGDLTGFESLRIEPYYGFAAANAPRAKRFLMNLAAATRSAPRWTLVHGDYSPKNVLVHAGRLVILDHEVAHWGDGAFDIGFSLTHLLAKAIHVPGAGSALQEAAHRFWDAYITALGGAGDDGLEQRAVHHGLGCLLARVVGRSPLEYLSETEREIQLRAAGSLASEPPGSIPELIDVFLAATTR